MKTAFLLLALFSFTVLAQPTITLNEAGVLVYEDGGVVEVTQPVVKPATPNLDNGDVLAFMRMMHDAFASKEWGKLLFFSVTLITWVLRRFVSKKVPVLGSSVAAITMTFALAFTGMLATSWTAARQPTFEDIMLALQIGFAAAGGWSILKALLEAMAKKWEWAKWLLNFMTGKEDTPPAPTTDAAKPS